MEQEMMGICVLCGQQLYGPLLNKVKGTRLTVIATEIVDLLEENKVKDRGERITILAQFLSPIETEIRDSKVREWK